jgi:hypothetical protein
MQQNLTPLEVCEALIGPPERLSVIIGYNSKAAYNWRHPTGRRPAGDLPSTKIMRSLLDHAKARGIPLTAEHLIWGATAEEVDKLACTPAQAGGPTVSALSTEAPACAGVPLPAFAGEIAAE